jgi:hypothetical protein
LAQVETAKEAETNGPATRWLREIELASRHESKWRERGKKIVERYRDDDRKTDSDGRLESPSRFNILYANTEVLKGVIYQRTPVPDVRRRFLDKDPVGRQASQILQRALSYCVDAYDFDEVMVSAVEDSLLPGRGVACVEYIPTMGKDPLKGPDGQAVVDDGGQPVMPVAYQEARCKYVEWDMYRESPAKRPSRIRWKAYGELMTRDDLVAAFGDKGKRCTLDWAPKDKENDADEFFKRALVWKIWDKKSRKVICVSKGLPEDVLSETDDPLGLEGFFPSPKPVYSITTTDSLIPVPEYIQYQDQAMELDEVTQRIKALTEELRVRGIADTSLSEVEKLAKAGDGEIIPIEDAARMAEIREKGGLEKAIMFWPIQNIALVLVELYKQREQIKQTIYEVTGIADIVRGATKATETLGAQEMKARYANVRIAPRQKAVANFARDLFRMKAEIIAEKFTPETLKLMTGPEMWVIDAEVPDPAQPGKMVKQKVDATNEIMALLRNDKLRGFRVDIETDSTVQPDASEEQKNRIEFLTAVSGFVTGIAPAVQAGSIPKDVALEFLSFGARGFKMSPQLEEAIDRMRDGGQGADPMAGAQKEMAGKAMQADMAVKDAQAQEAMAKAEEAKARAREADAKARKAEFELNVLMQGGMMAPQPGGMPA